MILLDSSLATIAKRNPECFREDGRLEFPHSMTVWKATNPRQAKPSTATNPGSLLEEPRRHGVIVLGCYKVGLVCYHLLDGFLT